MLSQFDEFRARTGDPVSAAILVLAQVLSKPAGQSLTVGEAAEYLHVSEQSVYELCRAGQIRHHRIGKGRGTIRFDRADLDTFREDAQREPVDLFSKHLRN